MGNGFPFPDGLLSAGADKKPPSSDLVHSRPNSKCVARNYIFSQMKTPAA